MNIYDKSLITLLVCYGLFFVTSLPLALRRISRNGVYGFRTKASMRNDATWLDANQRFGWVMIVMTILSAGAVVPLYLARVVPPQAVVWATVALLVFPALVACIAAQRRTNIPR